ncbi:MAG: insecticidal toxin protein [Candidatus Schekmanbacteria bacterium]|nr:MAG: insecticidal toxin protein [Candidatus Schekmanbacteria bacterium]
MNGKIFNNFHNNIDLVKEEIGEKVKIPTSSYKVKQWKCRFYLHQHPYVTRLIQELIRERIDGLMKQDEDGNFKKENEHYKFEPAMKEEFFKDQYSPTNIVKKPYPIKDLDFSISGAYSVYNWELFYHAPLLIALHLSKNNRFAEAQKWLHYIFDPTDDSNNPTPQRFWKVKPFLEMTPKKIEEVLLELSKDPDSELSKEVVRSLKEWREKPFRPHVIARHRQWAYMYKAVMAYLDNLISWGDFLFRQDTPESVDEALQIYVMAANILGPKPQPVPKKGANRPQTYASIKDQLDEFSNTLVDLEADIPFVFFSPSGKVSDTSTPILKNIAKTLYFCVPPNEKLLSYWDIVADRLFKIRNSMDITGRFRRLPLFAPPIDPALLARAAAAGLDVGAVIRGINQPLPIVRFTFLIQKALEIAQEVKSLGGQLLTAMEKEDAEAIAILRAKHERQVLEMVEHTKYAQLQEAKKSREALEKSLALAAVRYEYYERQLGREKSKINADIDKNIFDVLNDLERQELDNMAYSQEEDIPDTMDREIKIDIAKGMTDIKKGVILSNYEAKELNYLDYAHDLQNEASTYSLIAKILALIPEFGTMGAPIGVGALLQFGGRALSTELSLIAESKNIDASTLTYEANRSAKIGSYARREQEWTFQSNLALAEMRQILKQYRAAQIREAIAEYELNAHRVQMKHAKEIEEFLNADGTNLKGKKTNKALYAWMKRETRGLYTRCFDFAFDIAKKAERALQHELGDDSLTFIKYDYLAGKEGLLAGEKLYLDLKRMEMAYHENNRREYELIKHVSLREIDPIALIMLRNTGKCIVRLPEELFDMDAPGHYFRRIKTVAVTIPSVTGPHVSINCKLTLLKSSIRKTPSVGEGYARQGSEDSRFSDYYGSIESIVASSAQNDTGLFETNLRDERYLPFENSGVISEWMIELPARPQEDDPQMFDYDTISDVILHIRYTAREGGEPLRNAAMKNLKDKIDNGEFSGNIRLFSIRHEFPAEWNKFKNQTCEGGSCELTLQLKPEHYPFWAKNFVSSIESIEIFARPEEGQTGITIECNGSELQLDPDTNLLHGNISPTGSPTGELKLRFNSNQISDLWIAIKWKRED